MGNLEPLEMEGFEASFKWVMNIKKELRIKLFLSELLNILDNFYRLDYFG